MKPTGSTCHLRLGRGESEGHESHRRALGQASECHAGGLGDRRFSNLSADGDTPLRSRQRRCDGRMLPGQGSTRVGTTSGGRLRQREDWRRGMMTWFVRAIALVALALPGIVLAVTPQQVSALAQGETTQRVQAIAALAAVDDPTAHAVLRALRNGELWSDGERFYRVRGGTAVDALSGAVLALPATARQVVLNNRLRRSLDAALAAQGLASADPAVRARAIDTLGGPIAPELLPAVERALAQEHDPQLRGKLESLRASALLRVADSERRREAAEVLAGSDQPAVRALLAERLAVGAEQDPQVRAALETALRRIDGRLAWGERAGVLFSGLSLGSVLLLAALGLAVTYGLLGVINMAHGELMMIGAYATWWVQNLFATHWPGAFGIYLLVALPVSFLAAAAVGALMERGVIRWLYGRPLETLLATWGVSLILMQLVRSLFGAQNVQVRNPEWLEGGLHLLSNLVLPWNRIALIGFAALVLGGTALLLARTRPGLWIRAVTQNRAMAACNGIDTGKVDMLAFAFGSGIAGLAGCGLSQIGNVGPELGQGYIVDAFMVVVTGGVGQLAGTAYAGFGLGVANKLLEGWIGAVLAKIVVLALIVVFIQRRPQGLFALKGRSVE